METASVFLGIIILALSALVVLWPFLASRQDENRKGTANGALEALVARRDAIYATIRDLDFDYETGKLNEADYQAERNIWVERGIDVLKAIDLLYQSGEVLPVQASAPPVIEPELAELDAQIEAAVASRRHTSS